MSLPIDQPPDPPPDPPPPPVIPPRITDSALPSGSIGAAYSYFLNVTGGTAPFTFALTGGTLPAGLLLNVATGEISGTPTTYSTSVFYVTVTDAVASTGTASLSLGIPSLPSIVTGTLPSGVVGVPYFSSLLGTGGAPPYGFQITAGALPAGLVLATTGGITGTPTKNGSASITVQIYDSNTPQGMSVATFQIVIQPGSFINPVTTLDQCVLLGAPDGGLYAIVPGQRHDEDYNGNPVAYIQRWFGVPGPSTKQALLQVGGATVGAKGNGNLRILAISNKGETVPISSERRPMALSSVETTRDFFVKGAPKSERFGIGFDNLGPIPVLNPDGSPAISSAGEPIMTLGPIVDAWFELHVGILWVRQFYTARKG